MSGSSLQPSRSASDTVLFSAMSVPRVPAIRKIELRGPQAPAVSCNTPSTPFFKRKRMIRLSSATSLRSETIGKAALTEWKSPSHMRI